jgi:hypothetical protein
MIFYVYITIQIIKKKAKVGRCVEHPRQYTKELFRECRESVGSVGRV